MRHPTVQQALELLACEVLPATDALTGPQVVRDYLRLLLGDRSHEVFAVVFLDLQHRGHRGGRNVPGNADADQRLPA